jgi:arylsulfatase A-like enzyme
MQRHRWPDTRLAFLAALLTSLFAGLMAGCGREPADEPQRAERSIRRVILITVDTLRQDALSVYGSSTPTPNMDGLARDAVVFRRAYVVAPWTIPSLASVLTGLSPKVHRTVNLESRLPDGVTTLAEYMGGAGYRTAALGVNDLLTPVANLGQGFHRYEFRPRSTGELTREAVQWLRENREEEFFLWVHYLDPHASYQPPVPLLPAGDPPERIGVAFEAIQAVRRAEFVPTPAEREWIRKLYEAEVRYVDRSLGELFGALKEMELYQGSLIILTSDHGEEFWEHGSVGHGHTLYEELLRVPLIIKLPAPAAAAEVEIPAALPALLPTILDLCQVAYDKDGLSFGSLAPLWQSDGEAVEPEPIFGERALGPYVNYEMHSVVLGDHKYIWSAWPDRTRQELYDLARDPGEKKSVAEATPERVARLRELLDADADRTQELLVALKLGSPSLREIPEELKEQLKALGYLP